MQSIVASPVLCQNHVWTAQTLKPDWWIKHMNRFHALCFWDSLSMKAMPTRHMIYSCMGGRNHDSRRARQEFLRFSLPRSMAILSRLSEISWQQNKDKLWNTKSTGQGSKNPFEMEPQNCKTSVHCHDRSSDPSSPKQKIGSYNMPLPCLALLP